jgi:hypothetical protein
VLAELLMGRPLFPGKSELEILARVTRGDLSRLWEAELPPDLRGLLAVALSMDPERRFQTAREFGHSIDGLARARGVALEDSSLMRYLAAIVAEGGGTATRRPSGGVPTVFARPPRRPPPPPSARRHAPLPSQH